MVQGGGGWRNSGVRSVTQIGADREGHEPIELSDRVFELQGAVVFRRLPCGMQRGQKTLTPRKGFVDERADMRGMSGARMHA